MTVFFWVILSVVIYTYLGYTVVLFILSLFSKNKSLPEFSEDSLPEVSLVIAAYNEKSILADKIKNSSELNYPKTKLKHIWVTDGSTDGSEKLIAGYENNIVLHNPDRKGKMAAINRAMEIVETPYTIFCDANTMLHPDSILWMVKTLAEDKTGCVAGEKKIINKQKDSAAGSGEQSYWNYESFMKRLESKVGSTVGAAGELYGVKTSLFEEVDQNTVIDDFVVSLKIALKGYKLAYQPKAIASEYASYDVGEEKKRKIRIAAGSFQVLFGMPQLLNIFKYGIISFQYFSHKVLRWLVVPPSIPILLILNLTILYKEPTNTVFRILIILQGIFYLFAILGRLARNSKTRFKLFFLPYYILMMNLSVTLGFLRYLKGSQSAAWEKAKRQ